MAKAYGDLIRDGVVESQHGKGLFVSKRRQIYSGEERLRRLNDALELFLGEVLMLDFSAKEILERLTEKLKSHTRAKEEKKRGSHE